MQQDSTVHLLGLRSQLFVNRIFYIKVTEMWSPASAGLRGLSLPSSLWFCCLVFNLLNCTLRFLGCSDQLNGRLIPNLGSQKGSHKLASSTFLDKPFLYEELYLSTVTIFDQYIQYIYIYRDTYTIHLQL